MNNAITSDLEVEGGKPVHLKAVITGKHDKSKSGVEVEEYWVSPNKWRRTITSDTFSQTIVVNGDKYWEKDFGDYDPLWLRELITAIFEPLPMYDEIKEIGISPVIMPSKGKYTYYYIATASNCRLTRSGELCFGINFIPVVLDRPFCTRWTVVSVSRGQLDAKDAPLPSNTVLAVDVCFEKQQIKFMNWPGYTTHFAKYKKALGKQIAQKIVTSTEFGKSYEARIKKIAEITNVDETIIVVPEGAVDAAKLQVIPLTDVELLSLLQNKSEIAWPEVRGGNLSGVINLYVAVDKTGKVRECNVYSSDNHELDQAAVEQVSQWSYKPGTVKGVPVQVEGIVSLSFKVNRR